MSKRRFLKQLQVLGINAGRTVNRNVTIPGTPIGTHQPIIKAGQQVQPLLLEFHVPGSEFQVTTLLNPIPPLNFLKFKGVSCSFTTVE